MSAAHLFVDDVSKSFGDRDALVDANVLAQGGLVAVLGPNGCGKSTLLRCVATVLVPDTGTVRIDGLDPLREHERIEARRRIGYAPQEAGFDPRIHVFDAIDVIAVLKGFADTRRRRHEVFDVLDAVGLADRVGDRVAELSGGMKRRLVLAQALLGEPTLLVFDEPSASLDPEERLRWRNAVRDRRGNATVVVATHLAEDAADADAVLVLDSGGTIFSGSATQLAAAAAGRVWVQVGFPPPGVVASWPLSGGRHRCLGHPPPGAELVDPTIEEGYLLMRTSMPV